MPVDRDDPEQPVSLELRPESLRTTEDAAPAVEPPSPPREPELTPQPELDHQPSELVGGIHEVVPPAEALGSSEPGRPIEIPVDEIDSLSDIP